MYVGPWQEYALSKGKRPKVDDGKAAADAAAAFRTQMETAILASLDPKSAARALNAMESVIRDNDGKIPKNVAAIEAAVPTTDKRRLPPRQIVGQNAPYKLSLPAINTDSDHLQSSMYANTALNLNFPANGSMSERQRESEQLNISMLTPTSVRSTVSEPSYRHQYKGQQQQQQQQRQRQPHRPLGGMPDKERKGGGAAAEAAAGGSSSARNRLIPRHRVDAIVSDNSRRQMQYQQQQQQLSGRSAGRWEGGGNHLRDSLSEHMAGGGEGIKAYDEGQKSGQDKGKSKSHSYHHTNQQQRYGERENVIYDDYSDHAGAGTGAGSSISLNSSNSGLGAKARGTGAGLGTIAGAIALQQQQLLHTQPSYNTSAAINALKLARSYEYEVAKNKAIQSADFSAYMPLWGKPNRHGNSNNDGNSNIKLSAGEGAGGDHISKKVERVKRMQQLYASQRAAEMEGLDHGQGQAQSHGQYSPSFDKHNSSTSNRDSTNSTYSHSTGAQSPRNIISNINNNSPVRREIERDRERPHTPTVQDMPLTDTELMMISKYFSEKQVSYQDVGEGMRSDWGQGQGQGQRQGQGQGQGPWDVAGADADIGISSNPHKGHDKNSNPTNSPAISRSVLAGSDNGHSHSHEYVRGDYMNKHIIIKDSGFNSEEEEEQSLDGSPVGIRNGNGNGSNSGTSTGSGSRGEQRECQRILPVTPISVRLTSSSSRCNSSGSGANKSSINRPANNIASLSHPLSGGDIGSRHFVTDMSTGTAGDASNNSCSSNDNRNITPGTPGLEPPDFGAGGLDSLLNWSSGLDLDLDQY